MLDANEACWTPHLSIACDVSLWCVPAGSLCDCTSACSQPTQLHSLSYYHTVIRASYEVDEMSLALEIPIFCYHAFLQQVYM